MKKVKKLSRKYLIVLAAKEILRINNQIPGSNSLLATKICVNYFFESSKKSISRNNKKSEHK